METEKKQCKKCNKGLNMSQKTMVIMSVYILFAAIYGTIKLLKDILEYDGPIVVDCKVVPDENCYPMVAPGKSNAQMLGG